LPGIMYVADWVEVQVEKVDSVSSHIHWHSLLRIMLTDRAHYLQLLRPNGLEWAVQPQRHLPVFGPGVHQTHPRAKRVL
jgi:hypothetical protein